MERTEEKHKRMQRENDLKLVVEQPKVPLDIEETCEGSGYSPEIKISGLKAPFLALTLEEAEGDKVIWAAWNIANTDVIPRNLPKGAEVTKPISAFQARNDLGEVGYSAPCPPKGETHHYVLRVFGLRKPLDLNPASSVKDLRHRLEDDTIQFGDAMVEYTGTGEMTQAKKASVEKKK